jgi:hypothetical protein
MMEQMQAQQGQASPDQQQMLTQLMQQQQGGGQQGGSPAMTQAAMQSLMSGQGPAM